MIAFYNNHPIPQEIKNIDFDKRSIWNTLKIIDEIIKVYDENYGCFSNHKKASVESIEVVVDVKSVRTIDERSLRWIACNPDNLVETDKTGIANIPIKTRLSQYSYEVYENRVILGFLQNVIDYIENQITGFNKEIIKLKNIPECILKQLPILLEDVYIFTTRGLLNDLVIRKHICNKFIISMKGL